MKKEEKLKMLQKFDEKTLTKKVIIPLYESEGMGYKNVRYTHRILEFGKDIVCYKEDEYGDRIYIGIQVKKTKITTGDVSEILRQILEAFGNPFKDSDGKEKKLDKVVLLTSNEFTEEARDSLWATLEGAGKDRLVKCIDGNVVVDLLNKYLPSAFWEEYAHFSKYFHAMKEEFETIKDISAIGQKEPIPLEEIYVSLKLSEKLKELKEREIDRIPGEYRLMEEERIREQIFDADAVTKKFSKAVLVGDPGSGKTTLLKHLTLKSCKKNLETQERTVVPIFITLRQFSDSGKSLREYIDAVFEQYNFPKAKEFIEKDLNNGTCQLFLDGFDELASKERQKTVAKEIERFVQKYPENRFIVTSRTAGYRGELRGFQKVEVQEFDDHQIVQFITNWFGKINPEKAASMAKTSRENERIRALARNPLMIAIIAIIYEEDRKLPQRRVELYQRCIDVLLGKWDIRKKIKNKYDAVAKQKILRRVALKAQLQQKRSFSKEELLEEFSEYLPEFRIKKEKAEDVLTEIVKRNVLLKEVSIGVYDFLHLSFQEYLAALELRKKRDYETLLAYLYEPWWEEVVLLFAGIDRDATELIKKIKEKESIFKRFQKDKVYRNVILMGKCIADADHTSLQLRNEIANELWSLYQTEKSSLSERAIDVISSIKPDNIIDQLIEELKDEDYDVRWKAADVLGLIKSEKAVDPLIEALTDENSGVRRSAAIALGLIKSEKAVDPLIEALTDENSGVRERAVLALGRIKSEKAVDPLIEALTDENSGVRGSAAEALGRIKSEKAVDPLIEALTDENSFVRWSAAFALGLIKSEKAVDPLIEALTDENSLVRGRAAKTLGKINSEKAVDALKHRGHL